MGTDANSNARYLHMGICVTDTDRSKAFYKNVFGFTDGRYLTMKNEKHGLVSIEGDFYLRSSFLKLGHLVIELLHFDPPETLGPRGPRPMHQLGLTHLAFNVNNLEETSAAVCANGGAIVEGSLCAYDLDEMTGRIMFVTDPDGTRIELVDFPQDVVNA